MTNKIWILKAAVYFIAVDILFSWLSYVMLANGPNAGMSMWEIMRYVAIPVALLSVGIALREEKRSPTSQNSSKFFIVMGTVLLFSCCFLVLVLAFVSG